MVLSTKERGNLTELQCITAFYELGYQVSIPYGENSRYDFIADINNNLLRIQVKTSSYTDDSKTAIHFAVRSSRTNATCNIRRTYSKNEIDYFATYFNNQCYLIPVEETSSSYKTLRFSSINNNKSINWAADYELAKQLQKIKE